MGIGDLRRLVRSIKNSLRHDGPSVFGTFDEQNPGRYFIMGQFEGGGLDRSRSGVCAKTNASDGSRYIRLSRKQYFGDKSATKFWRILIRDEKNKILMREIGLTM